MKKTRPCIILSPKEMNNGLGTVIVAPLTTVARAYPTRIPLTLEGKRGFVALDQLRTIDQTRLGTYLGKASSQVVQRIKACISEMLVE
jgi:mRNA interferase MazF